jgi:hypothetical protein
MRHADVLWTPKSHSLRIYVYHKKKIENTRKKKLIGLTQGPGGISDALVHPTTEKELCQGNGESTGGDRVSSRVFPSCLLSSEETEDQKEEITG